MSESSTTKAVEWVVLIILIIIGVSLVPTVVSTVQSGMGTLSNEAVKLDSGARYNNGTLAIYGTTWGAAPFNMTKNFDLTNFTICMTKTNRTGNSVTGDITIYLEYADSTTGKPNGTILKTFTYTANSLVSDDSSTAPMNYTFASAAYAMHAGYNYSLVVKAASANVTECVNMKFDDYAGGVMEYPIMVSANGGATWTQDVTNLPAFTISGVYNLVGIGVSAILMGLIPFMFIVGLIIFFLVRLLRS
jgi:hypothetical protein